VAIALSKAGVPKPKAKKKKTARAWHKQFYPDSKA
jgi:hypothetical protein